jgi:hypothetical protein
MRVDNTPYLIDWMSKETVNSCQLLNYILSFLRDIHYSLRYESGQHTNVASPHLREYEMSELKVFGRSNQLTTLVANCAQALTTLVVRCAQALTTLVVSYAQELTTLELMSALRARCPCPTLTFEKVCRLRCN